MSFSTDLTDKKLKTLENRIAREYKRAYNDMNRQWRQYIKGYDTTVNGKKVHHKGLKERYAEQYQAYLDGAYTKEQFDAWYLAQVQRGEKYKKMRDDLADRMTKANEVAAAYINDTTPGIYSLNANYSAWQIEKANPGVDFTLVNEQTVKVLMTKSANVTEFRTVSVNPIRDYDWNTSQIQSALTSGILTGKSIDHLADAFLTVMQRNRTAAVRNARTAVTSAQNAGTLNTMLAAEAKGIKMMKRWYSMEDSRVRASHAKLNGQLRGIKEKFSNGLMYPGDSSGPPREVYNCRCTMEYVFPQFASNANAEPYEPTGEKAPVKKATETEKFNAWVGMKMAKQPLPEPSISEPDNTVDLGNELWNAYKQHADINNLNVSTDEAIKSVVIKSDLGKIDTEVKTKFESSLSSLASEYDTTLQKVEIMSREETMARRDVFASTAHDYTVDNSGIRFNAVKCGNKEKLLERLKECVENSWMANVPEDRLLEYIPTHEFAHTLIDFVTPLKGKTNWVNANYKKVEAIRKEVEALYKDYISEYNTLNEAAKAASAKFTETFDTDAYYEGRELYAKMREVYISKYSLTNTDEFFAEAFTLGKLGNSNNKYATRVMEIININFGKR